MPVKTMTTKKTTTTTIKKAPTPRAKVVDQVIPDLPSNPFAFEIFELVSKQTSDAKKVEVLRKFDHPSIKTVLIWNFDESVISVLPQGDVPYAAVDEMDSFKGTLSEKIADAVEKMDELGTRSLGSQDQGRSSIRKEFKKFYNFIRGGNDGLSSLRKETMFINILQGLHPLEAEIICLTKDKKLQSKYKISKENVSEAYPDITWGNRS
jgi:hypothetical protein